MTAINTYDNGSSFQAVKIGAAAPDFVLKDEQNCNWQLSDHLGNVVVLLFYPQNETLVCTRQLCSVRDNWKNYLETKAVIVGISSATPEEHSSFSQKRSLPIPLLADEGRAVTMIYGKHWLFPVNLTRTVVVIDAKGIIRNRNIMLRAFRPSDSLLITDVYAARGDAFNETRDALRHRLSGLVSKKID
jgi:peroxiredoxin Q/BCP